MLDYFWYRIRPVHLLLVPLSWLFGAVVALRRAFYRRGWLASERAGVPVIVVGNISVGGTGKTPVVDWLAGLLQDHGYHPGLILRGYGGSEQLQEVRADSDPAQAGDEAVLLARRTGCPVFAGRRRAAAARALLQAHPECDVLVSDDGLQHYALGRDFEIAVVDAQRGFGNGWLLPAGPLREPVRRLRSIDALVVNGDSGIPGLATPQYRMRISGERFRNLLHPEISAPACDLRDPKHAVAAIGYPQRFFAYLERLGLRFRPHPFPDHFRFGPDDLAFSGADTLLMTEKDAVKCAAFARDNWWYLPIRAEIDPALGHAILAKLRSLHGRQAA